MTDIFISYSREDRPRIEKLAAALEAEGFDVWWDRNLTGGAEFSKETETRLNEAKAVIVAWSTASVDSHWVADEATVGRDKGNLIPICLDPVQPKIGFRQFQTIDFQNWKGDASAANFAELAAACRARAGDRAAPPQAAAAGVPPGAPDKRLLIVGAAIVLLAGAAALFVMNGGAGTDVGNTPDTDIAAGGADADDAREAGGAAPDSSIAVLPFVNMSSDPEQEYFSDGISEELLNVLAQVPGLQVAGRTSAFAFKGKNVDLREIADILDVAHILEGSVRKSGGKVRVTAQLIRADNGFHLWSESYDRELNDIFAVQDEIASAILAELTPHLLGEKNVRSARADIDAYDLYLLGKQRAAPGDLAAYVAASEALDQSIALDPEFAPALSWRAYYELMMSDAPGAAGLRPAEEALEFARSLTERAERIDPASPDVLFARASVHLFDDEYDEAEEFYRRALDAKPNFDVARNDYAYMLGRQERHRAAVEQLELALAHNPAQADANSNLVSQYWIADKPEKAQKVIERWAEISPDSIVMKRMRATLLRRNGEFAEAIREMERLLPTAPDDPRSQRTYLDMMVSIGKYDEAIASSHDALAIWALTLAGEYDRAIAKAKAIAEDRRDFMPAQEDYLSALFIGGRWDELIAYYEARFGAPDAFKDAFDIPPYQYVVAPLADAGHPDAAVLRRQYRAAIDKARAAGIDFGILDFDEAMLLVSEGEPAQAVAMLNAATAKNFWPLDIALDPVLARLKDEPGYRDVVASVETKINEERGKLDLPPLRLRRAWENGNDPTSQ